jgi:hypothetical protein
MLEFAVFAKADPAIPARVSENFVIRSVDKLDKPGKQATVGSGHCALQVKFAALPPGRKIAKNQLTAFQSHCWRYVPRTTVARPIDDRIFTSS